MKKLSHSLKISNTSQWFLKPCLAMKFLLHMKSLQYTGKIKTDTNWKLRGGDKPKSCSGSLPDSAWSISLRDSSESLGVHTPLFEYHYVSRPQNQIGCKNIFLQTSKEIMRMIHKISFYNDLYLFYGQRDLSSWWLRKALTTNFKEQKDYQSSHLFDIPHSSYVGISQLKSCSTHP